MPSIFFLLWIFSITNFYFPEPLSFQCFQQPQFLLLGFEEHLVEHYLTHLTAGQSREAEGRRRRVGRGRKEGRGMEGARRGELGNPAVLELAINLSNAWIIAMFHHSLVKITFVEI